MHDLLATLNELRDRSHSASLPRRVGASVLAVLLATVLMYLTPAFHSHHVLMGYMVVTSLAVLGYGFAGALSAGLASATAFTSLFLLGPQPEHDVTVMDAVLLASFIAVSAGSGLVASRLHQSERSAQQAAEHLRFVARTAAAAAEHAVSLTADGPVLSALRSLARFDEIALYRYHCDESGTPQLELVSGEEDPVDIDMRCMFEVVEVAETWGRSGLEHKGLSAELALSSTVRTSGRGTAVYMPLLTSERVEGVVYLRTDPVNDSHESLEERMSAVVHELRLLAIILERQRLEGEAAAAQAKVEAQSMQAVIMQSVTHELKTPLAATRALVSHWIDEPESVDTGRIERDAVVIDSAMERLETSISELLEISRLKTDDWLPRREPCEVADVMSALFAQLPERWRSSLVVEVADIPMFYCDQRMVGRLLASFVSNAFVYGAEPVVVRAFLDEGRLVYEVEDRGPGLDGGERGKVFDAFFRGTQAVKRSSGTGLGLAIAAEIARLLDGTISVSDVVPSGACFRFSVPLELVSMPEDDGIGSKDERESDAG